MWLPRAHPVIKEADRRSRLSIPHDERSPLIVVKTANEMALRLWSRLLSFDQAASHLTAIMVEGRALSFNAFCWQPQPHGVDMFRAWQSWVDNINYVYPPDPCKAGSSRFSPTRSRGPSSPYLFPSRIGRLVVVCNPRVGPRRAATDNVWRFHLNGF